MRGKDTILWSDGDVDSLPRTVRSAFASVSERMPELGSVLVIDDMYASDAKLKQVVEAWREAGEGRIAVGIDDMQRRKMGAFDWVVNPEIGLREANYKASHCLLGERYALVRSGFAAPSELDQAAVPMSGLLVLVMLGGTDAFGYTQKALHELAAWDSAGLVPVVASGAEGPPRREVLDAFKRFQSSRYLGCIDASELAAWMQYCSFGVIGCGSSIYELAAMKLPFVGLSLVDNQTAMARKVESEWGLPILYCEKQDPDSLRLAAALDRLAHEERRPYAEVDTRGAWRVCDALSESMEER